MNTNKQLNLELLVEPMMDDLATPMIPWALQRKADPLHFLEEYCRRAYYMRWEADGTKISFLSTSGGVLATIPARPGCTLADIIEQFWARREALDTIITALRTIARSGNGLPADLKEALLENLRADLLNPMVMPGEQNLDQYFRQYSRCCYSLEWNEKGTELTFLDLDGTKLAQISTAEFGYTLSEIRHFFRGRRAAIDELLAALHRGNADTFDEVDLLDFTPSAESVEGLEVRREDLQAVEHINPLDLEQLHKIALEALRKLKESRKIANLARATEYIERGKRLSDKERAAAEPEAEAVAEPEAEAEVDDGFEL